MDGYVLANVLALLAAVIWLAALVVPARNLVRARNALLLRRGRPEDFVWTPATVPADFRVEWNDPPATIEAAVESANIRRAATDWAKALALVEMLTRHSSREGAIRADLETTFAGIKAGYGYCADFVRVYLAAASGVGLFCRQWAFSFDGFGGHGHTFVEVYDRQRAAWSFLDVYNNVYAVHSGTQTPVDALTLQRALIGSPSTIDFRQATSARLGFPQFEKLLDYYRRGTREWYLWWGNDVISRERSLLVRSIGAFSARLAHRVGSALGRLPSLVVMVTPDNDREVVRMEHLRRSLVTALAACAILAAGLGAQFAWRLIEGGNG